jgi:enamine deaminase RidA (YjgF/YER057c/UK114 family)|tara:strand:+ start:3972 stop:4424 length:453 start_codon:yes stop_codon:yes gene_type:complete
MKTRIEELGLILPPPPPPGGVYKPVVRIDNMLYVSGQVPVKNDGSLITGKLGADLDIAAGYAAARQVGLTMLATLKDQLDDLDQVKRLIKTLGMVNSHPDFTAHPKVINGFSELMQEIMGDEYGLGARSAVGMMLPNNVAVEIEAIFECY